MKPLVAAILLGFAPPIVGGGEATFKTAKTPKTGEGNAFELTKRNRVILKTGDHGYVVLDLLDSSQEDGGTTSTEACSISWTLITPDSVQNDTAHAFVRYRSEETQENSFMLTEIGGSETIELGGLSIRWSYASPERIFLYPSPGSTYAIISVGQDDGGQPATRSGSE